VLHEIRQLRRLKSSPGKSLFQIHLKGKVFQANKKLFDGSGTFSGFQLSDLQEPLKSSTNHNNLMKGATP